MTPPEDDDDITLPLPTVRWWEPDETTSWLDAVLVVILYASPFIVRWLVL